jgi:hypothetical protein
MIRLTEKLALFIDQNNQIILTTHYYVFKLIVVQIDRFESIIINITAIGIED